MKQLKVLIFLLSLFFWGCKKEELAHKPEESYVEKIQQFSLSNVTTDTSWVTADTLVHYFLEPVYDLDQPAFPEVFDSLNLKFEPNTPLSFNHSVSLPPIAINDFTSLSFATDSLQINDFHWNAGFNSSKDRWKSTSKFGGPVNKFEIIYQYRRIYYHATVKMTIKDAAGKVYTLKGKLKGSKTQSPKTEVRFW